MKSLAFTVTVFFLVAAILSGQPIEKAAHDAVNAPTRAEH